MSKSIIKRGKVTVHRTAKNDYGVKSDSALWQLSSDIFEGLENLVNLHKNFVLVDKRYKTSKSFLIAKCRLAYELHNPEGKKYGKLEIKFSTQKKITSLIPYEGYSKLRIDLSMDRKQFDSKIVDFLEKMFLMAKYDHKHKR